MTKINMRPIIILVFLALSGSASSQTSAPINRIGPSDPDSAPPFFYEYDSSSRPAGRGIVLRALGEDRVLKKGLLAPSAADQSRFASFLRLRNTGLIRLLPRELYDTYITHAKSPVSIRGGGAYYSFAWRTHDYGYAAADIEFSHNEFSVASAGDGYGILTILGDTPLEQITITDPRAHFIATYKPAATKRQARVEALRFGRCWGPCTPIGGGSVIDGLHYRGNMPVVENSTYLLRSIVYDYSDVLVAFRVIGKDADGGVTIAWKLLQKYRELALHRGK
jgi:hypothetical protein